MRRPLHRGTGQQDWLHVLFCIWVAESIMGQHGAVGRFGRESTDMRDIAIYGAGGFGREVACLIKKINECIDLQEEQWNLIGFFDDVLPVGSPNEYGKVLGGIDALNTYEKELDIAIAIGSPNAVRTIASKISNPKVSFPNIVSPDIIFLDGGSVEMGMGNIVCSRCLVSCNVKIGNFNIFNGYIPVGHDTLIGDYNVVMPSVNISGGVCIGDCNFFGVQSVVLQYVHIGNNVRVGANSVIMRHTKDNNLYMGNPAKKVNF